MSRMSESSRLRCHFRFLKMTEIEIRPLRMIRDGSMPYGVRYSLCCTRYYRNSVPVCIHNRLREACYCTFLGLQDTRSSHLAAHIVVQYSHFSVLQYTCGTASWRFRTVPRYEHTAMTDQSSEHAEVTAHGVRLLLLKPAIIFILGCIAGSFTRITIIHKEHY